MNEKENFAKEEILALKQGDVVLMKESGNYLIVNEVNTLKGEVSGKLANCFFGVNGLSIEELCKRGTAIAKFSALEKEASGVILNSNPDFNPLDPDNYHDCTQCGGLAPKIGKSYKCIRCGYSPDQDSL